MAWSCLSTAASRPSEFAPDRRKVANRREQGRHTRTDHPAPFEKDLPMTAALSDPSLDQIFRSARTFNGWADRAVADANVREIYDLMKWGPTSANCSPARFVWVRSADGKATLAGLAAERNKPKILQAPVTVIIGHDLDFAGQLPKLLPHNAEVMQKYFAGPGVAEVTAAPCRASTTPVWIRPFSLARESSRTSSAALATAIQLLCFRAILALV